MVKELFNDGWKFVHFVTDGIYFSARKNVCGWTAEIETEYIKESGDVKNAYIRHTILGIGGTIAGICEQKVEVGKEKMTDIQTIFLEQPLLWSPEYPHLYQLKSELICGGTVIETLEQSVGFRNKL